MNDFGVSSDRILPIKIENLDPVADRPDVLDTELVGFFNEEAAAEMARIETLMQKWETSSTNEPWREIRVAFHTVKGAANSIGHVRIGSISDGMEEVLKHLKPAEALAHQATIIKTCILAMEAMKALILEAANPEYNKVRPAQLLGAAHAIVDLKYRDLHLQGAA